MHQSNEMKMQNNILRLLYWAPRIAGIAMALFLSLFSFDAFQPGRPWFENLLFFSFIRSRS